MDRVSDNDADSFNNLNWFDCRHVGQVAHEPARLDGSSDSGLHGREYVSHRLSYYSKSVTCWRWVWIVDLIYWACHVFCCLSLDIPLFYEFIFGANLSFIYRREVWRDIICEWHGRHEQRVHDAGPIQTVAQVPTCMHALPTSHIYLEIVSAKLDLSCFDFRYLFWDKKVMREVAEANDAVVALAAIGRRVLERYRAQHTEDEMRDDTSIIAHLIRRWSLHHMHGPLSFPNPSSTLVSCRTDLLHNDINRHCALCAFDCTHLIDHCILLTIFVAT